MARPYKVKGTAGLLAIFTAPVMGHKFYLGDWGIGGVIFLVIMYLPWVMYSLWPTMRQDIGWSMHTDWVFITYLAISVAASRIIPCISIIKGLLLLFVEDQWEYDKEYNKEYLRIK